MANESTASSETTQTQNDLLLDRIVSNMTMAADTHQRQAEESQAREMLEVLADQVENRQPEPGQDPRHYISERIKELDDQISAKLNRILHARPLQKLEASWRGLHQLVSNTETGTSLKLRLLNATKEELAKDLEKAIEFDQSALFKKVYEEEYGTFGGNPFSVLMGDYEFGRSVPDIKLLTKLSNVAAAAHAPLITAASPLLFDLKSFADLGVPRDLAKVFESTALIEWNKFRETEDSRYVSMVLPHYLARQPYDPINAPVPGLASFTENVHLGDDAVTRDDKGNAIKFADIGENKTDPDKFLWGNAAWLLTQRITDAFAHYRWCAAIRGPEGGGVVAGLPLYQFLTTAGDQAINCPTEVAITDRREKELDSLGFIALCHRKNSNDAVFFGGQTTNKPQAYKTFEANANARVSSMLPYVLAASRFAHYLKVIMRDKVGSFSTRDNVQSYLNNWIADYVLINDNAPQDIKAQYPLREARVDVTEVPGRPGSYRATVFLRPHFQLEELTASIRLVAALPPSAAA
ncbi:type VI secretion system contractile sheath large subunit [Pseudomonas ovata]|uniref:type VI secretion system contractile sheath large subunit n=1 Tax=Pseudomonas ovata TaxID=1839709 RepID=UPI000D693571|nr:type VI secretion system contractile sheath large subunit [Pseudomonas ovata]